MARREWLERKIVVYVPSTHDNKPISDAAFQGRIDETVSYFSKEYGGSTRVKALGAWHDPATGKIVREKVAKVEIFIDAPVWDKQQREIYAWGERKQKTWGQSTVAFEKDSQMTFLKREEKPCEARQTTVKRRKPHGLWKDIVK